MAREGDICPACGTARLKLVTGTKNGRKWVALFCSDRSCVQPPEWIKDRTAPKPPNGAGGHPQVPMAMGVNPEAEVRLRAATEAWKAAVGDPKTRVDQATAGYRFIMAAYRGKVSESTAEEKARAAVQQFEQPADDDPDADIDFGPGTYGGRQ